MRKWLPCGIAASLAATTSLIACRENRDAEVAESRQATEVTDVVPVSDPPAIRYFIGVTEDPPPPLEPRDDVWWADYVSANAIATAAANQPALWIEEYKAAASGLTSFAIVSIVSDDGPVDDEGRWIASTWEIVLQLAGAPLPPTISIVQSGVAGRLPIDGSLRNPIPGVGYPVIVQPSPVGGFMFIDQGRGILSFFLPRDDGAYYELEGGPRFTMPDFLAAAEGW